MLVLNISCVDYETSDRKPVVVVDGGLDGSHRTGPELVMQLARYLLSAYGRDAAVQQVGATAFKITSYLKGLIKISGC